MIERIKIGKRTRGGIGLNMPLINIFVVKCTFFWRVNGRYFERNRLLKGWTKKGIGRRPKTSEMGKKWIHNNLILYLPMQFWGVLIQEILYFFGKKAFYKYCSVGDVEFAQKSFKRLNPKEQGEVLITLFQDEKTHPLFEKLLLIDHQVPKRYFQTLITLSFTTKNDFKHLLIDLWKHRYGTSSPFFSNFWVSLETVVRKMVGLEEKIGPSDFIDLDLFEKSERLWLKNTCQQFMDSNPLDPMQLMQDMEECLTWFCQKEIATKELVLFGLKYSLVFKNDPLFQYIFLNTFQKEEYKALYTREFVTQLTLICCDFSRKEIYPLLIKHYPLDDIPDFFNRCYEIVEKNQDKPFLGLLVEKRRLYRHKQQLKTRFSQLEGDCSELNKEW